MVRAMGEHGARIPPAPCLTTSQPPGAALPELRKVLLVDDEPEIRRIGELSLGRVGKLEAALPRGPTPSPPQRACGVHSKCTGFVNLVYC
jgi:hypothetical protein